MIMLLVRPGHSGWIFFVACPAAGYAPLRAKSGSAMSGAIYRHEIGLSRGKTLHIVV